MLDLNQRPKDSGLRPFLDSLDYAFAMGWRAYRRAPSSRYNFPTSGLGSASPCAIAAVRFHRLRPSLLRVSSTFPAEVGPEFGDHRPKHPQS